jgi:hypothetical protein
MVILLDLANGAPIGARLHQRFERHLILAPAIAQEPRQAFFPAITRS